MRQCKLCQKGSLVGGRRIKLRGKYNPVGKFRKYPNLQQTRVSEGKRVLACVSCIKGMAKTKAK